MKSRVLSWLVRCYPRVWRDRYGAEFSEFLSGLPNAGWRTVWDVSKGALSMQAHQNGPSVLRLAGLFGLAGLIIGGAVSLAISDRYVSIAVVEATGVEPKVVAAAVVRSMAPERLQALVDKHRLYPQERGSQVALAELLARRVHVTASKEFGAARRAFRIEFVHDDPKTAHDVAEEVTESILAEQAWASAGSGKMLSILDSASFGRDPIYPNRPVIGFIGVLIGATSGAVWALFRRRRRGVPAA